MVVWIGLSALSGCYYDNAEDLYGTTPCDATVVTWTADIQPLLQAQCVSCHSGASPSGGKDLSTLCPSKDPSRWRSESSEQACGGSPPHATKRPLSTCSLTKLDAWVAAGALEN